MKPVGAGAAQKAFEALRRKLAAEGLFAAERKRPLPFLPSVVGVVTSRSGAAAARHARHAAAPLSRRARGACVVGGAGQRRAAQHRRRARAPGRPAALCDVVIVGRGGGAAEDLAAFNDEAVVRAVAAFPVPVVSAVGHEVDVSLCDLVADLRAATPTAAAEAVVPVRSELLVGGGHRGPPPALGRAAPHRRASPRRRCGRRAAFATRPRASPSCGRGPTAAAMLLERALRARVAEPARRLAELASALDALSPLAVLERGYSLAADAGGRLVRDAGELSGGGPRGTALPSRPGRRRHRVAAKPEASRTASTERCREGLRMGSRTG